jgi:hypothetical protein
MSEQAPEKRPERGQMPRIEDLRSGRFSTRATPKRQAGPASNTPGQAPPVRRYMTREQAEALYTRQLEQRRQPKNEQPTPEQQGE